MDLTVVYSAVLTVVGIILLCLGGNWLVGGGVAIAKRFRINNLIIGMTIVAYGTSTPELAASIAAAGEHSAIILGNVVGSNIANVGMVIATAAILIPLAVDRSLLRKEIPFMLGITVLLIILSLDGEISTYDGILLLGILGSFGLYTCRIVVKQRRTVDNTGSDQAEADAMDGGATIADKDDDVSNVASPLKSIALIILGVILLYVGAIFTVDNAVILAETFDISKKIIGLTVIAIGTSLPEMITSVIAIRKGHTDIGVGNIIGSNIFNILLIVGLGATLAGIAVPSDIYLDYALMLVFSLSLFVALKTGVINRITGVCLGAGYVAYMVFTFLM